MLMLGYRVVRRKPKRVCGWLFAQLACDAKLLCYHHGGVGKLWGSCEKWRWRLGVGNACCGMLVYLSPCDMTCQYQCVCLKSVC
jgi:hypothetical protein